MNQHQQLANKEGLKYAIYDWLYGRLITGYHRVAVFTVVQIAEMFNVTPNSAKLALRRLRQENVIKCDMAKFGSVWVYRVTLATMPPQIAESDCEGVA